jgi:hypothetical protein
MFGDKQYYSFMKSMRNRMIVTNIFELKYQFLFQSFFLKKIIFDYYLQKKAFHMNVNQISVALLTIK